MDQNAASIDISCLLPVNVNRDAVVSEFEGYFVSTIYREWSKPSVYNALMIEDHDIVYVKIPVPREDDRYKVRKWVVIWAITKLRRLFRRLHNIHRIMGIIGIEDLRGLALKKKLNILMYKRVSTY